MREREGEIEVCVCERERRVAGFFRGRGGGGVFANRNDYYTGIVQEEPDKILRPSIIHNVITGYAIEQWST